MSKLMASPGYLRVTHTVIITASQARFSWIKKVKGWLDLNTWPRLRRACVPTERKFCCNFRWSLYSLMENRYFVNLNFAITFFKVKIYLYWFNEKYLMRNVVECSLCSVRCKFSRVFLIFSLWHVYLLFVFS